MVKKKIWNLHYLVVILDPGDEGRRPRLHLTDEGGIVVQ